jgi:multidrug efflux pump subunit AcrB
MERAIEWFSRNHVAGNFLMLAVLLAGFTTWFKLKKEIFPETAIDAMVVRIPYPNATPEEVERGVCVPVEEAIADLAGIKKLRSSSSQNVGVVTVEVETGYDVRDVMSDVKSRVDAIDNFPEEAEKPVLEEILIKAPVMSLTVVADTDEATLRKLAEQVRDDLLTYQAPPPDDVGGFLARAIRGKPRISQVQIAGVRPYEISIEVSEEVRTLQDEIDEGNISEAEAYEAIRIAGMNMGVDFSSATPAEMQIFGSNIHEFRQNVFTDVSRIYEGASPFDVEIGRAHV